MRPGCFQPPIPFCGPHPGGFQFSRHINIRAGGCQPQPCFPSPCPPPININNFGGCAPCPPQFLPVPTPVPFPVAMPTPVFQQPQTIVQPVIVNNQPQAVAANQGSFVNEFNPMLALPPLPAPAPMVVETPKKGKGLLIAGGLLAALLLLKPKVEPEPTPEPDETPEPEPTPEPDDLPVLTGGGLPTGTDAAADD